MANAGTVEIDVKGNVAPLIGAVQAAANGPLKSLGINIGANTSAFTGNLKSASAAAQRDLAGVASASSGVGASLTKLGVVTATAGAVGVVALKGLAESYEAAGKETLKLQRLTGGTAEDMSRLRFVAQQSGIAFDTLSGSVVKLSRSAAGEGARTLEQLGVSFRDGAGNSRAYIDVLGDLAAKFQALPNGVEKNALALKLFGRSGADLIPILNKGRDGIAELAAKSDEFGATLSGKDTDAVKEAIKTQRDFQAAIDGLKVSLGREVFPALETVAKATTAVAKAFNAAGGPLKGFVGQLAVFSVGAAALGGALTIVGAGISALTGIAGRAVASVKGLAGASSGAAAAIEAEGTAAVTAATELEVFGAANAAAIASVNAVGAGTAAASITEAGVAAEVTAGRMSRLKTALSGTTGTLIAAAAAYVSWSYAISENSKQAQEGVDAATISVEQLATGVKALNAGVGGPTNQVLETLARNMAKIDEADPSSTLEIIADKLGIYGATGLEAAKRTDIAAQATENLGEVLDGLPADQALAVLDELKGRMIDLGVPTAEASSLLSEFYDKLGGENIDPAVAALSDLGGALTDAKEGLQGLVGLVQAAADPFLSLAEANLSLQDAQDGVADAQQKYTDIVQRNTDAIKTARTAVLEASKALQKAKADTGPGSDAADSAEDAVSRAEDAVRKLKGDQARQIADARQRSQDLSQGKVVTEGFFGKDFGKDIERANRELEKARKKRDDILSGNSEQVVSATGRLADAEAKLNEELGNAGPQSDAARRANNDLEQAQLAAVRSAEGQQMAQASVNDAVAKFPDLATGAVGYLQQLTDSGKITASTFNAVAAAITSAGDAAAKVAADEAVRREDVARGVGAGGLGGTTVAPDKAKKTVPGVEGAGVTLGGAARGAVDFLRRVLPGFAAGGYIPRPTIAQLHANEVVLPLSNPRRTSELLDQVGITPKSGTGMTVNINQTNVGMDPTRTADATVRGVRAAAWSSAGRGL